MDELMKIPKNLMFEYLLSLENYSDSHPTLKDITMKEALDAQKQIIDLGFTDQDIIAMKSEELMMEYKLWKQETCLLYTSPSPRDRSLSRMPSSA